MIDDAIGYIKAKVERSWKRGEICRAALGHGTLFPWQITLGKPSSKQMLDDFSGTQDWVKNIQTFTEKKHVQLQWQTINHRTLGAQRLPVAVCLVSAQQAASLIGQAQQLKQWRSLYQLTIKQLPDLQPWLLKYPLKVLAQADVWQRILAVCVWMRSHPNPRIYLRQVDVVGVDSKFIEQHKRVLADLFDCLLPVYAIDDDFSGVAGFAWRFGFLDKPAMLRMRPLDAGLMLLHSDGNQDVMMTAKAFASLETTITQQVKQVVIVENEINYLAFPALDQTLLIFGSGYGFEALKAARWLDNCALFYWGDLDTHGFAILNQLKAIFPQTQSFLMDKQTIMRHQHAWGTEPTQEKKTLKHLNAEEADMYDILCNNRLVDKLRLEQEHIAFSEVVLAMKSIIKPQGHGEES